MVHLLSRYLLSVSLFLSITLFTVAYTQGWDLELAVLVSTIMTLLAASIVERIHPFKATWNNSQGDIKMDVASALVLAGILDPALKYMAPIAIIALYSIFTLSADSTNLGSLPIAVQIIMVTLLVEFGRYWSHRLHHTAMPLWRFHAMHHSSVRLYAFNNLRFHPLNYIINFSVGVFPVMLLGFSAQAFLGYLAISQPVLMLQHANIPLRNGGLNYLFNTNELHRWHHSTSVDEANSNYGNAIVLWDQLFGTYRYEPSAKDEVRSVGLFQSSNDYPATGGYCKQLCTSFKISNRGMSE
ncbi:MULTISPECIES: sterol desaturase family protein [Grimontia]|uniref:Fatty acid hydroxylase superfamily protein n=1 Tax=Grimontia marina TaxID=646534 RepID=A0A128F9E9_9GAMM|nr:MULTISPECIES: sterol desaturase family protein [Grimontia]WRV96274.1 sterol desaturase family protein [Grimontia sp. NTOU-MAR1]CZF83368.1 Fatty acid hydroxylase superfamily protein [Grimontia marina]